MLQATPTRSGPAPRVGPRPALGPASPGSARVSPAPAPHGAPSLQTGRAFRWGPSAKPLPLRRRASVAVAASGARPPFNVVITGGTKGVGKALAAEFLAAGDSVAVCSRDAGRVAAAVEELRAGAPPGARVFGAPANVARAAEVAAFADAAAGELGSIDIWINNAGTNAYAFKPLLDQSEADISSIIETNVLGVLLCCREAIRVMRAQPQGGHVFTMDGAGADGGATPRFAAYGATKRSLEQLSKSLRAELRLAGVTTVGVHNLSPGMVTTDLLMAGADNKVSRFFINCLAEEPATVAAALVPRVRAVPGAQRTSLLAAIGAGEYIRFLTKTKAYGNIIRRLVAGERKDRFVSED